MADYQDLYTEQLRRTASGVEPAAPPAGSRRTQETSRSAARTPVTVEVIETARGPVISGRPDGDAFSLRTPARVERTLGFEALLPLLRSRSGADVQAALRQLGGTGQQRAGGRHVRRHSPARGRAGAPPGPGNRRWPVPAWSSRHQWTGGYEELPALRPHPVAVSANDRAAGGGDLLGMDSRPPTAPGGSARCSKEPPRPEGSDWTSPACSRSTRHPLGPCPP